MQKRKQYRPYIVYIRIYDLHQSAMTNESVFKTELGALWGGGGEDFSLIVFKHI